MVPPLLSTKLYFPPLRRDFVPRQHLLERLDEGLHRALTLVSAPAGFGKTTILSEWPMTRDRWRVTDGAPPSAAWFSLDAEDNELGRFFSYLIAALATMAPEIGKAAEKLLRLPMQFGCRCMAKSR